ncbi:MAG: hypothetical protein ACXAEN_21180 [Candidatus Thorarchaeota archaeon]|jgi:hypothetical protein
MRVTALLLFILIGSVPILGMAQATTSQGLYWGVSEGERFRYTYSDIWSYGETEVTTIEEIFVEIYTLPEIPDPLYSDLYYYYQLTRNSFIPYFMNETIAIDRVAIGISLFPLGNWSAVAEMVQSRYGITTSDGANSWSYSTNETVWLFPFGDYQRENHHEYSKTTGLLTHYTETLTNNTTSEIIHRRHVAMIQEWGSLLVIGGVGVGVFLLALFVMNRRRSDPELSPQLGLSDSQNKDQSQSNNSSNQSKDKLDVEENDII